MNDPHASTANEHQTDSSQINDHDHSGSILPGAHHNSHQLHPMVNALLTVFEEKQHHLEDSTKYQVSRTVSLLAAVYEKARNAVEFRAEHLIRRAAIERILKRRIMIGGTTNTMGENLIVELLWAKYIDSSQIDDEKVKHIQEVIDKYLIIKVGVLNGKQHINNITWDYMLGLLSSEVEEIIVPTKKREALNNFFYQAILPKIAIPTEDEKTNNILTYIAVERVHAQSDDSIIRYDLIKLLQPRWIEISPQQVNEQVDELFDNMTLIDKALRHPLSEPLIRYVRKHNPAFLLIRDFLFEKQGQARSIVEHEGELEQVLTDIASRRYKETGTKVRRAVIRSIIYLFLTKMIFAFLLEAPFDLFITKEINYVSLSINIFFPVVVLFLIAGFLRVPGAENTHKLIAKIKTIFYHFDNLKNDPLVFNPTKKERKPMLNAIFRLFYLLAFILSFGFISFVLTKLHFNIASQIIFIFFLTLVSFFAYRIRASAKEYEVVDHYGFVTPIVDFFFIPILKVGRALSGEIAKLNIFMFVFDFILEAPLKVIFEFMEEWFRFIRTKKDEII